MEGDVLNACVCGCMLRKTKIYTINFPYNLPPHTMPKTFSISLETACQIRVSGTSLEREAKRGPARDLCSYLSPASALSFTSAFKCEAYYDRPRQDVRRWWRVMFLLHACVVAC